MKTVHPPVLATVLALLLAPALAPRAAAQPAFVEVTPTANPYFLTPETDDFWVSAVAPADADGDGDLDLAVLGFYVVYNESAEDRLVLLLNQGADAGTGAWSFAVQPLPLGTLTAGASDLAWGDVDGDGDFDLAVGSNGATAIFRNDGGSLARLGTSPLPAYDEDSAYSGAYDLRSVTWADFDNDGDADLLVPSVWDPENFQYSTRLMRNDGPDGAGGWLFAETAAALDPTVHAQTAWGDDDGDGDLDLLLVNLDPNTETGFVRRFANDAGAFSGADLVPLRVEHGLADWGDYDGDGDFDVLVVGNVQEADGTFHTVLRVYTREGALLTETDLATAPGADWLDLHAATWADYDSDGDVDLLATGNYVGEGEILGHSKIFANEGGTFAPLALELPAPISSVGRGGAFTWLDLDGDGDLDYLVAGAYFVPGGNGLVESRMHLYRNGAAGDNQPPATPGNLAAASAGDAVALSWSPAADDHTPAASLTYDLELRPLGQAASGARRLPEPGNVSGATSWTLAGLPPGSYAWTVRAVDAAFHGGPRAQGTFSLGVLFADGFEGGTTAAWSATVP